MIHYDRNLGKGYAVQGTERSPRAALDLVRRRRPRPRSRALADYLAVAERESLDFAIGSKRHPESVVHYPRSRRVGELAATSSSKRVLFRLDVRDTQVGLKVFRREVVDEVMPLLLVKQFAFDLEFLAVANALGFTAHPRAAREARLPLHGIGRALAGRPARARRHGRDLLPAPDPPLLPAQALAPRCSTRRHDVEMPLVTGACRSDGRNRSTIRCSSVARMAIHLVGEHGTEEIYSPSSAPELARQATG